MIHICNPSNSRGGDWEHQGSRPTRAKN
jgi:hypothetical protein